MKLHEYQAKECFRAVGIPVPPGRIATTPVEAELAAEGYGGTVVIKAQVHSGGRGKAGGVKLAGDAAEARDYASQILGMDINGFQVDKVLVTPAEEIDTEAYVGVLIDRKAQGATFIVSPEGGIDIEEVRRTNPEAIRTLSIDPRYGMLSHQAYWLASFLYDDPTLVDQAREIVAQLYDAFRDEGS